MQAKTTGIILHQTKYSDSSVIMNIYTRDFGRMAYLVRGVNKKKSNCRTALLQPLTLVEFEASHNANRNLHSLKELNASKPLNGLFTNPLKSSLAMFMAEILYKTLKHTENDEDLYDFLEKIIIQLNYCESGIGNFHFYFLMKLSEKLGFFPNIEQMDFCQYFSLTDGVFLRYEPNHIHYLSRENTEIFKKIILLNYDTLGSLPLTKQKRNEMLNFVISYYKFHQNDFQHIRSLEILQKLWE